MIIKNREEIIEQLTDMLIQFDKDARPYQTDVYLYYNAENQTAELDTFVNVGGNSWLNDEHYTLYCDKEHYFGVYDYFQSENELADALEIPMQQLAKETSEYMGENFDNSYSDYRAYIDTKPEYVEKLQTAYNEAIDDLRPDYAAKAEQIMSDFESEAEI